MVKRLQTLSSRAGLGLALGGVLLCALLAAHAEGDSLFEPDPSGAGRAHTLPDRLPDKPSLPPVFTVPVGPLGFSAPGPIYLGARNSLASLDFLDENRLLFTFRVPGLIRREVGSGAGSYERQIRAVVLALPAGTVEAEALWTVHDRVRYLWMLKDGHFLLRDRDGLQQGNANLELKPLLQFPGPLLWLEMDPTQQFLVTDSREPVVDEPAAGEDAGSENQRSDQDPATAATGGAAEGQRPAERATQEQTELVLRILRRESGKVMLVSRVQSTVHLPINGDGYLESLRGNGQQWLLNLNYFSGGSMILGHVDSICTPVFDFISQREVLVTACTGGGGRRLLAMDTGGRRLWEDSTSAYAIWPLTVMAPNGSRLARETLAVTHAVNAYDPLDREDVKGQLVRVFDAANGKVALEAPASPALDAGGNVAISPSGRRVAVLNAGAIQVFDLPAPPQLAESAGSQPTH